MRRTKSDAGHRTLPLPVFAIRMLERRRATSGGSGPLFPDSRGGWRDPSKLSRELRQARGSGEFAWVTSHVFRKTCATLLDEGELSARQIADQLGHAKVSMTQDNYLGRRLTSRRTAETLDRALGSTLGWRGSKDLCRSKVIVYDTSIMTPSASAADLGFCSSDWTRTSNHPINSRVLCH